MTIPATMKAAVVPERGGPRFRVEHVPTPAPGPGQILIRVEAAAVNFSGVKRRRGDLYPFATSFPFIPGGEVAGTVVARGPGVDEMPRAPAIGARVFALAGENGFGGYAQFACSFAPTAVEIPDALSFQAASVLLVAGTTAKLLLAHTAQLREGETLLVPSATGGVGSFLVGIARRMKAGRVLAAAHGTEKARRALDLGANDVVDTTDERWPARVRELTNGRGVDVALEASGGPELERTLECLAPFGRLVVYGAASGRSGTLSQRALDRLFYDPVPNQAIVGFNLGSWFMDRPEVAGQALASLVEDVLHERVRMPTIRTLPLAKAAEAHELLESRRASGKLVLEPWS